MIDHKNIDTSGLKIAKAPWNLTGKGYMLLYRFNKKEISNDKFLSEKFKNSFCGGFGALMALDYDQSNAGPYGELLFIPGKFRYGNKKKHTISKIYVSTIDSIFNGRENWAIPKEHADSKFVSDSRKQDLVEFSSDNNIFFSLKIKPGFISFPVNTAFLPFPLVQENQGKAYYTKFTGSGWGKFIKIKEIYIDAKMFPSLCYKKPLVAIKIDPFNICFPEAIIKKIP